MRALVTGGTGFIGANLVRRLLSDGHEVHLLVRPGYHTWRLGDLVDGRHTHLVEPGDRDRVRSLVISLDLDWVFNLAAHGAYPEQGDVAQMVNTNVTGFVHLAEAAAEAGIRAFVQAGSSSEYGFKDHPPSEQELLTPNSAYSATKASASLYAVHLAAQGVPITVLRIYSAYGPWEEPSRLVPTLVGQGLRGRLPPLVSPDTARDFVYVDDVVEAFVRVAHLARLPQPIYNIGSGHQTSLRSAVESLRRVLPIKEEPRWGSMSGRSWDTSTWVSDCSAAERDLSWTARTEFEAGLRATIAWMRQPEHLTHYLAT